MTIRQISLNSKAKTPLLLNVKSEKKTCGELLTQVLVKGKPVKIYKCNSPTPCHQVVIFGFKGRYCLEGKENL